MNSLQRIQATLRFERTDRVPVIPQVFGHAAIFAGKTLGEYVRNGETLARCQLQALAGYGYDAVFALMDAGVETEAAGSQLAYRTDIYPCVARYVLDDIGNFEKLVVPDPNHSGRMPELLKAATILRTELLDETLVVGCVLGPMTLAMQLLGPEKGLFLAADEPALFGRVLDFAADVAISFGLAQIAAGVHTPFVFDPSASPAVVPPQYFREFLLPRLTRIFSALTAGGSVVNWLHIAGPVEAILPYYPEAGVGLANFDYCIEPLRARRILPGICLNGNIKPVSFVEASPREIAAETAGLLDQLGPGRGFILSSGCEIPPEARSELVAAMVQASRMKA
jgi:uroporphyrinogen decarboxylase